MNILSMCVSVCHTRACCPQRSEERVQFLGTGIIYCLWALMWVLGIKPRCLGRAVNSFNLWTIYLSPFLLLQSQHLHILLNWHICVFAVTLESCHSIKIWNFMYSVLTDIQIPCDFSFLNGRPTCGELREPWVNAQRTEEVLRECVLLTWEYHRLMGNWQSLPQVRFKKDGKVFLMSECKYRQCVQSQVFTDDWTVCKTSSCSLLLRDVSRPDPRLETSYGL